MGVSLHFLCEVVLPLLSLSLVCAQKFKMHTFFCSEKKITMFSSHVRTNEVVVDTPPTPTPPSWLV